MIDPVSGLKSVSDGCLEMARNAENVSGLPEKMKW